jgi:hypothetical protein
MKTARMLVMAAVGLLLLGCSGGGGRSRGADDPLHAARRADLPAGQRVDAIAEVKERVASGQTDRLVARYAMKEMAWALDTPEMVRAAALESILWDEQDEADSRQLVREMLPTEPGRGCVAVMATAAAEHAWTEITPALVRSLSRPVPGVTDADRAEYQALAALYPGEPLPQVVLGVFMDPQTEPGPAGLRLDMRVREAAWDLVGRLVPDRAARASLMDSATGGDEEGRRILNDLRTVRDALGVVPARGEEVRWALRLVEERTGRLSTWWEQAAAGTARLGPAGREGLELRHVEPVRWASIHRPEWLTTGRESLLDELQTRLAGRQIYPRTKAIEGLAYANAESLSQERDRIGWGDALSLLVIDEALADSAVTSAVFATAGVDHDDRATEHGGMLWSDADGFHAQHFPPRGTPTPDDRRFVAPREMIDFSGAALAHFHFHVADWRNRDYAGPSPGDFDYAAKFGRACVVFTGISRDLLDADAYFPGGVVVDLGEVRAPAR